MRFTRKQIRRADREERRARDPWFGKRRRAGEMGQNKSKAALDKKACRGKVQET